jgi:hypothetical protein
MLVENGSCRSPFTGCYIDGSNMAAASCAKVERKTCSWRTVGFHVRGTRWRDPLGSEVFGKIGVETSWRSQSKSANAAVTDACIEGQFSLGNIKGEVNATTITLALEFFNIGSCHRRCVVRLRAYKLRYM